MAYVEMEKVIRSFFSNGNPTSSYLWRNIMPQLKDLGRCIAVDLIGMGDSDKLDNSGPDRYTLKEHHNTCTALGSLGVDRTSLLLSTIGEPHWVSTGADNTRGAVKGVAHMEGVVKRIAWEEWPMRQPISSVRFVPRPAKTWCWIKTFLSKGFTQFDHARP